MREINQRKVGIAMLIKKRKNVSQAFLQRHTIKREESRLIPAICTIATNSYCISQIDKRRDVTSYNFGFMHKFDAGSEFFDIFMYYDNAKPSFETLVTRKANNKFYYASRVGISDHPFELIKRDLRNINFKDALNLTNSQYQSAQLLFDILESNDTCNMDNSYDKITRDNDDALNDIMQKLDVAFGMQRDY